MLVFSLIASKYYVVGVIWALIISMILALLVLIYYLKKLTPFIFDKDYEEIKKKPEKRRIFKFFTYLGFGGGTFSAVRIC